jgi:hypothetical protein
MLKYSNKIQKVVFLIYFRPFKKSVRCGLILSKVRGHLDCCKQSCTTTFEAPPKPTLLCLCPLESRQS